MTITAKFAGVCSTCKGTITIGQRINWVRGAGSTHADAAACAAVKATPAAAPVVAPVLDLSAVVAFLKAAKEGRNGGKPLAFPKTRFAAPGSGELQLSLAGDTSKNPGAVYVKVRGEYAGKVQPDGRAFGLSADVVAALRTIAADPAAAGAAYGRLTGNCSFCTQGLSDEGSLEVGYGPKCAKNYGLPHKPRGSAKVTPVLAPVAAPVVAPAAAQRVTDGDCDGTAEWNLLAAREEAAGEPTFDAPADDDNGWTL